MARAWICFPSMSDDFWVQALMTNNREKLSIKEVFFLSKLAKSNRALVGDLEPRYLLRVSLGLSCLGCVWKRSFVWIWTKENLFKNLIIKRSFHSK